MSQTPTTMQSRGVNRYSSKNYSKHKRKLEISIDKLETRKLRLLEEIYELQKLYENKRRLNKDLTENNRVEVFSKSKHDSTSYQSRTDGFIRHEAFQNKLRKSVSDSYSRREADMFNSTLQNFKSRMIKSRNKSKNLKVYKKMATAEDLVNVNKVKPLSKNGQKQLSWQHSKHK